MCHQRGIETAQLQEVRVSVATFNRGLMLSVDKDNNFYLRKFLICFPFYGAVIGGCGGLLTYFVLLLLPWLHDHRRKLVVPLFLIGGGMIGLYQGIHYYRIFKKIDDSQ